MFRKGEIQMNRIVFILIAAFVLMSFPIKSNAYFTDLVVNIPGTSNVYQYVVNPIEVPLEPGIYNATPVNPSFPGAIYTAYSYYSGGPWSTHFIVADGIGSDRNILLSAYPGGVFSDPNSAFQNAISGTFTLTMQQRVYFGVGDSWNGDNLGGVSVHLVQISLVPIPGTIWLLASCLGSFRLRKLKKK